MDKHLKSDLFIVKKNPDLHRDFNIDLKTITFQQQFRKLIQRLHLCVNEL